MSHKHIKTNVTLCSPYEKPLEVSVTLASVRSFCIVISDIILKANWC